MRRGRGRAQGAAGQGHRRARQRRARADAHRHDLVDEYVLPIFPLVLGSGQRLFPDGGDVALLSLVDSKPTSTGVVIATYHPGLNRRGR